MRRPGHRYFPGQTYKFGNRREAFATSLRPWLLRRLAGIAQDEQSPFVVVHEDVAAGVDGKLLAPVDFGRMRAGLRRHVGPLRRHEKADLLGQARVTDVEDAQPGVEPGNVDE